MSKRSRDPRTAQSVAPPPFLHPRDRLSIEAKARLLDVFLVDGVDDVADLTRNIETIAECTIDSLHRTEGHDFELAAGAVGVIAKLARFTGALSKELHLARNPEIAARLAALDSETPVGQA